MHARDDVIIEDDIRDKDRIGMLGTGESLKM